MVYFDESGIDNNERYAYGWGLRGKRVFAEKPGHSTQRTSICAGLFENKLCAPLIFDGYCNKEIIKCYFETVLLPHIGTGKTIVLDNASFHKWIEISDIVNKAGCSLLFLPAYSPDLNPIEHHWAYLKNNIRRELEFVENDIWKATCNAFEKMGNS